MVVINGVDALSSWEKHLKTLDSIRIQNCDIVQNKLTVKKQEGSFQREGKEVKNCKRLQKSQFESTPETEAEKGRTAVCQEDSESQKLTLINFRDLNPDNDYDILEFKEIGHLIEGYHIAGTKAVAVGFEKEEEASSKLLISVSDTQKEANLIAPWIQKSLNLAVEQKLNDSRSNRISLVYSRTTKPIPGASS